MNSEKSSRPTVNFEPEAWVKLADLKPHPKNPRVDLREHREKFESLKRSIEEGVFEPIKVSKLSGFCLAGHQRLRAFSELGYDEVPVMYNDCKTEKEEVVVMIKDNNEWGAYDYGMAQGLITDLDLEIGDLGFDEFDLKALDTIILEDEDEKDPDMVPVPPQDPVSARGQIYQLGEHRLMCGDSTNIDDVERLMGGQKADMVFTDPPYNTGMSGETCGEETLWRGKGSKKPKGKLGHMFNDDYSPQEWHKFLKDTFANMFVSTKGEAAFYVCIDWRRVHEIKAEMEELMKVSNVIVWDKVVHGLGSDYKFTYELIVVGKKGKPEIKNRFAEEYRDVWHLQRKIGKNENHATAKPVDLCGIPIRHASKQDDIVLDLFGGSGSTLIAAEKLNRKCYMMELEPKYIDVIIKRWEEFTGEKAKLLE